MMHNAGAECDRKLMPLRSDEACTQCERFSLYFFEAVTVRDDWSPR